MNMRNNLIPLSFVAIACTMQASSASSASQDTAEAGLDKRLAGRTAEMPRTCVSARELRSNKSYGEDVIVFDGTSNNLVFVNRPVGGCPGLNNFRALKIKVPSSQICRGDIAEVFDATTRTSFASCVLGDFVPYRRAKAS